MKKIILAALVTGTALVASPAMAQTSASGSVGVTGSVAGKCSAVTPITGSITLNELAKTDGTIEGAFTNQTGGLSRSFTVKCTTSTAKIQVSATPLNLTTTPSGATGYTGRVDYTATLTAAKAGGGTPASTAHTTNVTAPTAVAVGDFLANSANNVTVAVANGFTTPGTALLESGSYSSTITVTVSPS